MGSYILDQVTAIMNSLALVNIFSSGLILIYDWLRRLSWLDAVDDTIPTKINSHFLSGAQRADRNRNLTPAVCKR